MNNPQSLRTHFARLTLPIALLFPAVFAAHAAAAELTLPPIFAHEMILQRNKPVNVWGKSFAGDTITVTFGGASVQTTVEVEDWSVQLPAMPASAEGRTLTVGGTTGTKTFNDVLVGEVWLAGGQSNMAWHIRQEIDDKTFDMIQNYDVGGKIRFYEQRNVSGVITPVWTKAAPMTSSSGSVTWSVVGLHFAKHLYERYGVPVAILQTATGGVPIQSYISAEAMDASGLPPHPDAATKETHTNGFNYDRFVRDLIPFSATGAMWVHGEANAGQYAIYDKLLQTLIADWRDKSGQDLTFLIAQLPSYSSFTDRLDYKGNVNWRYMREAMTRAVKNTLNTAEVVTIDTMFEWMNIHPTDKKPIGDRFGLAARAVAYGEDVLYKSPSYKSHTVQSDTVTIEFHDAPNGLKVDGYYTQSVVNGFMLAGDDLKFRNATAEIVNSNQIQVRSPDVPNPVHIRYDFIQAPQSNLCSAEGLPVNPFRTDTFAGPEQPPRGDNQAFLPDPTPPVPAGQAQLAVVVSEDANARSDRPNENWDGGDLSIKSGYTSYLKFNVNSLPAGAVVESVTLRMYDNQNQVQANGSNSFDVFRVTGPWDETTVTFNTRPAHDTNQLFARHQQKGNYKNGRAADFPLDPAMFAAGNAEHSMVLVHTGASWRNTVSLFDSKDSVDGQVQAAAGRSIAPTLFINYSVLTAFQQWQLLQFGCLDCPEAAPDADPDKDGATNEQEFRMGTDPRKGASVLRMHNPFQTGSDWGIRFPTVAGKRYSVQYKDALTEDTWRSLPGAEDIPGDGEVSEVLFDPDTLPPKRFFRVEITTW
jgi:sialate O-acetylesterase